MADIPQLPTDANESPRMALVSNALAIIGFIILFIIIVWGIFHIVSLSGNSIGGLFGGKPTLSVTAPKSAPSGQPVTISWKYSGKEQGTYSFLYQCQQNFAFSTGPSNAEARIPCGSAIPVGSSTSASIVPMLSGASAPINVPITVVFVQQNGTRTEGSATISITPAAVATTPPASKGTTGTTGKTTTGTSRTSTTGTKTSTYQPTSHTTSTYRKPVNLVAHAASGPADLSVRIVAVGAIDPSSGALIPRQPTSPNDIVGVEFDIANIGGSATGRYIFNAQLPTSAQGYLYTSPLQISLQPGEHILNTLRFAPNMGAGSVTIIVDPSGAVADQNRTNNIVSQQI